MPFTDEQFESLLAWLDPDREAAGRKYEIVRSGLVRVFTSKGFADAEDLADETIRRVTAKLPGVREGYVGEPEYYFRAVARNVALETWRRLGREAAALRPPRLTETAAGESPEHEALRECLELLPPGKRELILDYHAYGGRDKVVNHEVMAGELGVTVPTLRLRAHRIRAALEECVRARVRAATGKRKPAGDHYQSEDDRRGDGR